MSGEAPRGDWGNQVMSEDEEIWQRMAAEFRDQMAGLDASQTGAAVPEQNNVTEAATGNDAPGQSGVVETETAEEVPVEVVEKPKSAQEYQAELEAKLAAENHRRLEKSTAELAGFRRKMEMSAEGYWTELRRKYAQEGVDLGLPPSLYEMRNYADEQFDPNFQGEGRKLRVETAVKAELEKMADAKVREIRKWQHEGRGLPITFESEWIEAGQQDMGNTIKDFYDSDMDSVFGRLTLTLPELDESEQVAWQMASLPHKPGTLDPVRTLMTNEPRPGESDEVYYNRLKNYLTQDQIREWQLRQDAKAVPVDDSAKRAKAEAKAAKREALHGLGVDVRSKVYNLADEGFMAEDPETGEYKLFVVGENDEGTAEVAAEENETEVAAANEADEKTAAEGGEEAATKETAVGNTDGEIEAEAEAAESGNEESGAEVEVVEAENKDSANEDIDDDDPYERIKKEGELVRRAIAEKAAQKRGFRAAAKRMFGRFLELMKLKDDPETDEVVLEALERAEREGGDNVAEQAALREKERSAGDEGRWSAEGENDDEPLVNLSAIRTKRKIPFKKKEVFETETYEDLEGGPMEEVAQEMPSGVQDEVDANGRRLWANSYMNNARRFKAARVNFPANQNTVDEAPVEEVQTEEVSETQSGEARGDDAAANKKGLAVDEKGVAKPIDVKKLTPEVVERLKAERDKIYEMLGRPGAVKLELRMPFQFRMWLIEDALKRYNAGVKAGTIKTDETGQQGGNDGVAMFERGLQGLMKQNGTDFEVADGVDEVMEETLESDGGNAEVENNIETMEQPNEGEVEVVEQSDETEAPAEVQQGEVDATVEEQQSEADEIEQQSEEDRLRRGEEAFESLRNAGLIRGEINRNGLEELEALRASMEGEILNAVLENRMDAISSYRARLETIMAATEWLRNDMQASRIISFPQGRTGGSGTRAATR